MRLSDYESVIGGTLLSDGTFETLEYCTSLCNRPFLSFLENPKYMDQINSHVSCIITTEELHQNLPQFIKGVITVEEPKKSFVLLHNFLASNDEYAPKKTPTKIGKNCKISPLACIANENVSIGDNVEIAPFVVIKENVTIGDNCVIHENCVIGGKSFNFVKTEDNQMIGMVDLGQVVLENNVEICSQCHIAGGPLPSDTTRLEENVKLDALVHVGHGTKIGRCTLIPAGAQIAGNVVIGADAWIGVNATIANRIVVQDGGRVSLGSVVTRNVEKNQTVTGNFAINHQQFIDNIKKISEGGGKLTPVGFMTSLSLKKKVIA